MGKNLSASRKFQLNRMEICHASFTPFQIHNNFHVSILDFQFTGFCWKQKKQALPQQSTSSQMHRIIQQLTSEWCIYMKCTRIRANWYSCWSIMQQTTNYMPMQSVFSCTRWHNDGLPTLVPILCCSSRCLLREIAFWTCMSWKQQRSWVLATG